MVVSPIFSSLRDGKAIQVNFTMIQEMPSLG